MFRGKVVAKIETNILRSKLFFPENRAVYEIVWKNMLQPDRPPMTLGPMRFSCCLRKGTNTHSEYVILIAHPQKWLRQRAWMLRYTCTA